MYIFKKIKTFLVQEMIVKYFNIFIYRLSCHIVNIIWIFFGPGNDCKVF